MVRRGEPLLRVHYEEWCKKNTKDWRCKRQIWNEWQTCRFLSIDYAIMPRPSPPSMQSLKRILHTITYSACAHPSLPPPLCLCYHHPLKIPAQPRSADNSKSGITFPLTLTWSNVHGFFNNNCHTEENKISVINLETSGNDYKLIMQTLITQVLSWRSTDGVYWKQNMRPGWCEWPVTFTNRP